MSDVREQLTEIWSNWVDQETGPQWLADAILERFDVVEKPVVTDEALGKMCMSAACITGGDADYVGMRLAERLADAGLRIVKVDTE